MRHLLLNRYGQCCSRSPYRFSCAQSIHRSWASSYIFHWLLLNDKWWQLELEISNFILECLYLYSWFLFLQFARILFGYCELVGCLCNLIVLSDWTLHINIFRGRVGWARWQLWFQLVITIVNRIQSRSVFNGSRLPFLPVKDRVFWIFIQWRDWMHVAPFKVHRRFQVLRNNQSIRQRRWNSLSLLTKNDEGVMGMDEESSEWLARLSFNPEKTEMSPFEENRNWVYEPWINSWRCYSYGDELLDRKNSSVERRRI